MSRFENQFESAIQMMKLFFAATILALSAGCAAQVAETDQTSTSQATVVTTTTAEPEGEASPQPSEPEEFTVDMIEASVVQVLIEGSFAYPFDGTFLEDGTGSGFVFTEEGHILTNHHVVAGAATVKVRFNNSSDFQTAQLVGSSECSDLAVLKISSNDHPALPIAQNSPSVGTDVTAAGFPPSTDNFEAASYTLTRGIVSTVSATGDSPWASVGEEIEHDAHIRNGGSGGPLVNGNGEAIGINYASDDELGTNYAISLAPKQDIIDSLRDGNDIESFGINGEALFGDENGTGVDGIWIYGVESGSPADQVGLNPGDVIIQVEGLPAADEGLMTTYCDVLRSRGSDSVTSIEVYRSTTDEYLRGQFNGKELAPVSGLAAQYDNAGFADGVSYTDYVLVTDSTGTIEVELPTEWSDIDGDYDYEFGGPSLWASTNLDDFWELWGTPGVAIDTTQDSSQSMYSILNDIDYSADCNDDGILEYDDGWYTGYTRLWTNCPDNSAVLVLAALPESQRFIVRLEATVVTDADIDALDRILETFFVYED